MSEAGTSRRRAGVGSILVLGIASSALTAVAAAKPWADLSAAGRALVPGAGTTADSTLGSAGEAPLALALALVALAGWGAVLVTRGWFRLAVTAVGAVASWALLVVAGVEFAAAPEAVRHAVGQVGGGRPGADLASRTGWYWAGLLGALVLAVSYLLALRGVRRWPTMGSRYDAPGGSRTSGTPVTNLDLWKAIDEGQDPTRDPTQDPTGDGA